MSENTPPHTTVWTSIDSSASKRNITHTTNPSQQHTNRPTIATQHLTNPNLARHISALPKNRDDVALGPVRRVIVHFRNQNGIVYLVKSFLFCAYEGTQDDTNTNPRYFSYIDEAKYDNVARHLNNTKSLYELEDAVSARVLHDEFIQAYFSAKYDCNPYDINITDIS
ncbi:MAG: hypothetical protein PHN45_00060 [Methylococcales bacterium]|nr:hypothetical protein [Methylococcales bacterium]